MPAGMLFAFAAYCVFACGDASIKALGSGLSIFEIGFFNALFSVVPMLLFKPRDERWRDTFRIRNPLLVHGRALSQVISTLCIIVSFTTIPFAEVYSVVFLTPVFVVVASVFLLREHVPWPRWMFLAASFVGVLLVVRPGFRELQLGHLTALVATGIGVFNIVGLRHMGTSEKRVSLLGTLVLYALVANGVLMLASFSVPSPEQWLLLIASGAFGGCGQMLIVAATRQIGASEVAPAQYSQMLWALILGATFFSEFPDAVAFAGMAILVVSGLGGILFDRQRRVTLLPPAA